MTLANVKQMWVTEKVHKFALRHPMTMMTNDYDDDGYDDGGDDVAAVAALA